MPSYVVFHQGLSVTFCFYSYNSFGLVTRHTDIVAYERQKDRPACTSVKSGQLLYFSAGAKCHEVKTWSVQLSNKVLLDFSLTVKAATLIFISGRGSAISSAKEGDSKSGFI